MKVSTIYFSPTNTTKTIVEAIANVFSNEINTCDITFDRTKNVENFNEDDLLIIGMPVYGGRIPPLVQSFVKNLKGNNTLCIPVVVYGNRDYDDALLELSDYLKENGFKVASAGVFVAEHSFGPEIAGGRPNDDDLKIAREFAQKSKEKIENIKSIDELEELNIPGNRPYKETAPSPIYWGPETLDTCNDCNTCIDVCPMGIIDRENPKVITDVQKCLHCCACVKSCPQNAKVMKSEMYNKFKGFLIANCSKEQKQPELFI